MVTFRLHSEVVYLFLVTGSIFFPQIIELLKSKQLPWEMVIPIRLHPQGKVGSFSLHTRNSAPAQVNQKKILWLLQRSSKRLQISLVSPASGPCLVQHLIL